MNKNMEKELRCFRIQNNSECAIRNKITLISFIASLLVIYVHSDNLSGYAIDINSIGLAKSVYYIEFFGNRITSIAVPIFFLLSGMLFFRNFEMSRIMDKLKTRVFSVVIPYLLWASIYYFYFIIVTRIPMIVNLMNNGGPVEISVSMYLKWLWSDAYYTLWFLKNLIIFIAMTPLIWVLLKNHLPRIPTGLMVIILLTLIPQLEVVNIRLPEGMIFYLVGCYVGLNCREYLKKRSCIFSILGCIYFVITISTGIAFESLLCEIILLISIWFMMDFFILDRKLPWFMYISFFTYVAHDALLQGIKKIFLKLFGKTPICALISYLAIPLVVFVILAIIAFLFKKTMPKTWRVLVGGR